MPKFEKQYVHFMWSDELKGKKVFYGDCISDLKSRVEHQDERYFGTVIDTCSGDYPFRIEGADHSSFCYYDPYYDLKIAHEQGKKIECKRKGEAWEDWDYTPAPAWLDDHEYRIMQEEENPVTHRELSRWLAQGRGEWRWYNVGDVTPYAQVAFHYCVEEGFLPVKKLVLVRKWEDEEWHEPSREYMGLNTQEV